MTAKIIPIRPPVPEPPAISLVPGQKPGTWVLRHNSGELVRSIPLTRSDLALVKQLIELAELFDGGGT